MFLLNQKCRKNHLILQRLIQKLLRCRWNLKQHVVQEVKAKEEEPECAPNFHDRGARSPRTEKKERDELLLFKKAKGKLHTTSESLTTMQA